VNPEKRKRKGLQWEGFADKEVLSLGDGISNNSKYDCLQIKTHIRFYS